MEAATPLYAERGYRPMTPDAKGNMMVSPYTVRRGIRLDRITSGSGHHFFGYYDKSPWDCSGRWMLGLEAGFMDRQPEEGDHAIVGIIDTANGYSWRPLARTSAWNWQQGCMLQWLGGGRSGEMIFNDRRNGCFISRILNVHTGEERTLELPVYGVSRDGTRAVSLNFARLHHQRPGYGYAGVKDKWAGVAAPSSDGIYSLDLVKGGHRLIMSVAQIAEFARKPDFDGRLHRFNHLQFSPDGKRFAFLHRYRNENERSGHTRFFTADFDGRNLHCLSDEMVSHYDWRDNDSLVAWAQRGESGCHYWLFRDRSSEVEMVAGQLFDRDGHCSFSPDGRWMLTDTYPDKESRRSLMALDWERGRRIDLGGFFSLPLESPIRCDLHPRWSPDGRQICVDSTHEGNRQMYRLDIADIIMSKT